MTKGRRFLASFGAEARKLSMIFARRFVALFGRHRYGERLPAVRFGRKGAVPASVGWKKPRGRRACLVRRVKLAASLALKTKAAVLFRLRFRPVLPFRPSDLVGPRRTITVLKRDRALWVPLEIRGDESRGLHRFPRGVLPCPVTARFFVIPELLPKRGC